MHNLPDWFPEMWKDEVKVLAQQMNVRIADTVENGGMFSADTCYMPRIGPVEAIKAARLQELGRVAPKLDWIKVDAEPVFLPIVIWDPDKSKMTIQVMKTLARSVVSGIARARDDMIITAFNDAALNGVQPVRGKAREAQAGNPPLENIRTIGDYNTVLNLDVLAEAYALIGDADVDVDHEKMTFVSPFRQKVQFGLDPLMTNSNTNKAVLPWDNFQFRTSQRLASEDPVNGVDCYLYAYSAAATAWNDEVTDINERLGAILGDMIGQWFQGGACVKEPKAIIRIKAKKNFAIERGAIPVFDRAA